MIRARFDGTTSLGAVQMNRHYPWMIPASHLALFLALGLPLARSSRKSDRASAGG